VSTTARSTDRQNLTASCLVPEKGRQPRADRGRRFDPILIGFWLGTISLGVAGCILGARMPYHHPVAVAISVVWWGLFCGCSGGVVGALLGMGMVRAPNPPPGQPGDGDRPAPTSGRS
jgi:hypothetical protein